MVQYEWAFSLVFVLSIYQPSETSPSKATLVKHANLTFVQLAALFGHKAEEYDVITEDGYILKLFNIKGEKKALPVLVAHGFMDSADTFLLRGNDSLAITLANNGYDLWATNVRGSKYGLRHLTLDSKNVPFWNFSFHELAYYDLTANIDFILNKTNAIKLDAIGHSQGNLLFYIMGSLRPEYNDKVNVMIAMAPISYIRHIRGTAKVMARAVPIFSKIAFSKGVFIRNDIFKLFQNKLCKIMVFGYTLCVMTAFFSTAGYDVAELEPKFFEILIEYFPSSVSIKSAMHLSQVHRFSKLAHFNYGPKRNRIAYNSSEPPEYDLSKVTMKVVLLQGLNDYISTVKDTKKLKSKLQNYDYRVVKRKYCNHIDFIWGANMKEYIFPEIFEILEEHNKEIDSPPLLDLAE